MEGWRQPKLLRNLTNSAAKYVFRVPSTSQNFAGVFLVFAGPGFGRPADGDTVSIGQYKYTFRTAIASPYDVLIGASAIATATNLLNALTGDAGLQTNIGITYGLGTEINPDVGVQSYVGYVPLGSGSGSSSYIACVTVQAPVVGVSYNGTAATAVGQSVVVLSDTASLAHTTTVYVGGTNPNLNTGISAPASWLEFADPDTNVVRSQVVNDVYQRYYFASPSQAPAYNTGARIAAGQPAFTLGINPPTIAPGVQVTGANNQLLFPSYGSANVGGGAFNPASANVIILIPITVTQACTINDVNFTAGNTDATQEYAGVIYSDSNSINGGTTPVAPSQLLGTGAVNTGITAGAKAASAFFNPISLSGTTTSPTVYWIGIITLNNIALPLATGGGSNGYYTSNVFAQGAPFNAPASLTGPVGTPSIWATCTTSDVLEARAYVYTWVSAFQEESAPSPFTIGNGYTNAVWGVSVSPPPLADIGTVRNIAFARIYRSVTGASGSTVFFWVADIPITQTLYNDTQTDAVIATHIQLPSTTYFPPPANLQGLMNLPNGMVVGFVGNQIWFAVPFLPHAWPPGNVFNTEFPIIGLGLTNGALIACTEATSFVLTGNSPSTMSITKCQPPDPCISRGSILSTDTGVFYMSPNGLIQVTNLAQSTNVTELWITREKWASLTPQKYARAVPVSGCYFCYGTTSGPLVSPADNSVAQQGFALELNQDNTSFTIWPQPGGHRVGFTRLSAPNGFNVDNVEIDPWTGIAMVVQNGQVWYLDFTDPAPIMQAYSYTSKVYQQNTKKSYSAMRMFFTVPPNTPALSAQPNTSPETDPSWQALGANQWATILVYADVDDGSGDGTMQLVCAREVRKSGELLRILGGFKAERWQFKVMGRVVVSNLQVATSVKELANV